MCAYPEELLPTTLFDSSKPPILWIGSGMSKRYIKGFLVWDELLKEVCSRFGISSDRFISIRNHVKDELNDPDASDDDVAMSVATELSHILNKKMSDGEIDPKDILSPEDLEQFRHGVEPIKLIVCSMIRDIEFRSDYSEEISLFKTLKFSIPVVITTNYDKMIETLFDNEYKVYRNTDEYFQSDILGVGEIHKIHGTVDMPRSIILTKNDYALFDRRSAVVISRIVSAICDSPMIIMGYSMSEKRVRNILGSMASSFSEDVRRKLSKNILFIEYSAGCEPILGDMQIDHDDGTFMIRKLTISDFKPILDDLTKCTYSMTIPQVRKLKSMLRDLIVPNPTESEKKRIAYVGIEGIDDVDPQRTAIAFGTNAAIGAIKSSSSYLVNDIVKDILSGRSRLNAESIVDIWFEGRTMNMRDYIPIFYYLDKLGRNPDVYSDRMKEFVEKKRSQYHDFIKKRQPAIFYSVTNLDDLKNIIDSSPLKFNRSDLITYCFLKDIISQQDAFNLINAEYEKAGNVTNTQISRALTFLYIKP